MAFADPEHFSSWEEVKVKIARKEAKRTHIHVDDTEFQEERRAIMNPTRSSIPGEVYINDNP